MVRSPRFDRHAFDADGILMGLEKQQFAAIFGRNVALDPGQQIFAQRRDRLAECRDLESPEKLFEIVGHAMLEEFRPGDAPPHRIDAGNRHQVAQRRQSNQAA